LIKRNRELIFPVICNINLTLGENMQKELIKNPVGNVIQMIKLYPHVDAKGKQQVLESVHQVINSMYDHYKASVQFKGKIDTVIKSQQVGK
jgi:hypothetical protein